MSWLGLSLVEFLYLADSHTKAEDSEYKQNVLRKTHEMLAHTASISSEWVGWGHTQHQQRVGRAGPHPEIAPYLFLFLLRHPPCLWCTPATVSLSTGRALHPPSFPGKASLLFP